MAKLSTPYHDCETKVLNSVTGLFMACKRPAYRKHNSKWTCKPHTHMAQAAARATIGDQR
jgi:hypothetical protein